MAKGYDKELTGKLRKLTDYCFGTISIEEYEKEISQDLVGEPGSKRFAVFISVCNTRERATVFHASGVTLEEAVALACSKAIKGVKKNDIEPKWVKLEIVIRSEEMAIREAVDIMFSSYNEFFRRGISMDRHYQYAYTEGEINGNRLLNYKEKLFDLRTFNKYTMVRDDDVILKTPSMLLLFDCAGYFCDDRDEIYSLYREGYDCGRRIIDEITPHDIRGVVGSSVRYLISQMHPEGSFNYGYYPIFHKLIPGYNILRHTSTIWSLVCASQVVSDKNLYRSTLSAIKYMLCEIAHYDNGISYLVEAASDEIKLGGNGVAIITLTQFMKIYETDEYIPICEELGRGILGMMNPDGSYVHVLDPNTLDVKEEYRTVYYDGEATFALCRLAAMTGSELWLEAARRAVDHFIENGYEGFRDHWVAYAVNELTLLDPDPKYYDFALRNIWVNLETIHKQPTSYHTYLELLMAGYETYRRVAESKMDLPILKDFDIRKVAETIFYRARHMLNGYGYPEYVMYFKKPYFFRGAFFVRHDGYRVRIDDVQHFCGAYIAFYKRYDEIYKYMTQGSLD
ncbi:MAG: hypothetical protein IJ058_03915 [Lachnospiraceae bacterium]|nr:hypothetical protein [Lachnospiraceae bacterium]